MKMIFLVDGDNNIGTGLQGVDQLTAEDSVLVFYQKTGLALSKIKELCKGSRANIQYLESVKGGKNSIDFQIITELGVLVGRGEADCAYVISQDKGYEAAMSALRARYAGAFREVALRPSIAACLKASYLLRVTSLAELEESLSQEFGVVQGAAAFRQLESLFHPAEAPKAADVKTSVKNPAENAAEKPAAKRSRSRRRTPASSAQKPSEKSGEASAEPSPKKPAAEPAEPAKKPAAKPAAASSADGEKVTVKATHTHRGKRKKKESEASV